MSPDDRSAYLLNETRRHDPDRYLCALLAPAERRDDVLTLVAFNHELARIPEIVSQPMAGMIRLQWWREALDELAAGQPGRRHPLIAALRALLAAGLVEPDRLQALIDAREPALERIEPEPGPLEHYATTTSGALQRLIYGVLGGGDAGAAQGAQAIGSAFGLVRLAEALRAEVEPGAAAEEATRTLRAALCARGAELLRAGRAASGRPSRRQIAAFLPAALADAYLRQLGAGATGLHRPAAMPLLLTVRALARRP